MHSMRESKNKTGRPHGERTPPSRYCSSLTRNVFAYMRDCCCFLSIGLGLVWAVSAAPATGVLHQQVQFELINKWFVNCLMCRCQYVELDFCLVVAVAIAVVDKMVTCPVLSHVSAIVSIFEVLINARCVSESGSFSICCPYTGDTHAPTYGVAYAITCVSMFPTHISWILSIDLLPHCSRCKREIRTSQVGTSKRNKKHQHLIDGGVSFR